MGISHDISDIGAILCQMNFDNDFYEDYLAENNLRDTEEVKRAYIEDGNVDYDVDLLDADTFRHMDYASMSLSEIEDFFGERIANDVLNDCLDGSEHEFELAAYTEHINVDNPSEVNAEAIRVLRHGPYFKNCRGFILTNGVIVYTPIEHNQCTKISGIKGTSDFIQRGNIRLLDHSIDIAQKPTKEQRSVLETVVEEFNGDTLYLDLMNKSIGMASNVYNHCYSWDVLEDIDNYFNRGIKPKVNTYESTTDKSNILNEAQRGLKKDNAAGLSIDKLQEWWEMFNEEYFQGELRPIKIQLTATSTRQGCYHYRRNGTSWIDISTYYNHNETTVLTILLHEMIHQWQRETDQYEKGHGSSFKWKMSEINRKGGWDIDTTLNVRDATVSDEYAKESCHIVVVDNGEKYWIVRITNNNPQKKLEDSYYNSRTVRFGIDKGTIHLYKTNAPIAFTYGLATSLTRWYSISYDDFKEKVEPYILEDLPVRKPQIEGPACYVTAFFSYSTNRYQVWPCANEGTAYAIRNLKLNSIRRYGQYIDSGRMEVYEADEYIRTWYKMMKNTNRWYEMKESEFDVKIRQHVIRQIYDERVEE